MRIEEAIEVLQQAHVDSGVMLPEESFEEIEGEILSERVEVLNEFLDNLTYKQQLFFALKLSQGLPPHRRAMVLDLILDEESPIRSYNG